MSKKYKIPEEEPRMVSEPAVACRTRMGQVHMSFDLPETIDEESFRFLLMVYTQQLAQKGKPVKKNLKNGNQYFNFDTSSEHGNNNYA